MATINLDDLGQAVERKVILGGHTYEVRDFGVQDYIELARLQKELQGVDEEDLEAMLGAMNKIIEFGCPDLPEEKRRRLNERQLIALMELIINFAEPEDVKEAVDQGKAQEGSEAPQPQPPTE